MVPLCDLNAFAINTMTYGQLYLIVNNVYSITATIVYPVIHPVYIAHFINTYAYPIIHHVPLYVTMTI